MSVINVNTNNFEAEVLKAEGKVLVDFSAVWCGPCKMLAPIVDEVAEEQTDIKVCKLDIDESFPVAVKYRVNSVPTLIVFEKGEVVNQSIGFISKEEVEELIK